MRRFFSKTSTRPAQQFLPRLEALESRWCPSAAGIVQSGHTLAIQGDGANDTITVSDNGQGGVTASITLANGTKTLAATGITDIKIEGGGGNDTINYALTGVLSQSEQLMLCLDKGSSTATLDYSAGLSKSALAVAIGGGTGSNHITTNFGAITNSQLVLTECLGSGGATANVNFGGLVSGSLTNVTINGGAGNDHVFAQVSSFTSSNLQFYAHLGGGTNTFDMETTGTAQNPISLQNSVVHFDVDTGSGGNAITFNANNVNVDLTSRLNLETCSGAGKDNVTLNYSGQLNGELHLDLEGGAGNDTMSAILTLAQGSTGRVNGLMRGGAGNDTMTFDIYDNSNPGGKSTLSDLDAILNGGSGHNSLTATHNVKVIK